MDFREALDKAGSEFKDWKSLEQQIEEWLP